MQCNGVYKNLLTKILSGYFFAETRTPGGYPTLVYSTLLNIATKLELQKATHAAKLELLEATLVALESYKRRCTVDSLCIAIDTREASKTKKRINITVDLWNPNCMYQDRV